MCLDNDVVINLRYLGHISYFFGSLSNNIIGCQFEALGSGPFTLLTAAGCWRRTSKIYRLIGSCCWTVVLKSTCLV